MGKSKDIEAILRLIPKEEPTSNVLVLSRMYIKKCSARQLRRLRRELEQIAEEEICGETTIWNSVITKRDKLHDILRKLLVLWDVLSVEARFYIEIDKKLLRQ